MSTTPGAIIGQVFIGYKEFISIRDNIDPSVAPGVRAPVGSLAIRNNANVGEVWLKIGVADTAWTQVATGGAAQSWLLAGNALTGGAPDTPNEVLGSTNNFDVVVERNGVEQYRLQDNSIRQVVDPVGNPAFRTRQVAPVVTTVDAASVTVDVPVPSDYAGLVEARIVGRQTGGAAGAVGDTAQFIITAAMSNVAGVAAMQSFQSDFTDVATVAATAVPTANGGNLRLTLTGEALKNLSWFVSADLTLVNQ